MFRQEPLDKLYSPSTHHRLQVKTLGDRCDMRWQKYQSGHVFATTSTIRIICLHYFSGSKFGGWGWWPLSDLTLPMDLVCYRHARLRFLEFPEQFQPNYRYIHRPIECPIEYDFSLFSAKICKSNSRGREAMRRWRFLIFLRSDSAHSKSIVEHDLPTFTGFNTSIEPFKTHDAS